MKLKLKLIVLFLSLTLIPLLFVGLVAFSNTQTALLGATFDKLNRLTDSKEAELLGYLQTKKIRVTDFASDGFIRTETVRLAQLTSAETRKNESAVLNRYLAVEKQLLDRDVMEILILDGQGAVVAGTHSEDLGTILPVSETDVSLIGVHVHDVGMVHDRPTLTLDAPLVKEGGGRIGTILVRYDLVNLREVLSGEYTLQSGALTTLEFSGSLGIYLVDKNGQLLFSINKMEELGSQKISTEAVKNCLDKGLEINKLSRDFQGKEVLMASMCPQISPDIRWALVVEQDKDEALLPVKSIQTIAAILALITSVIVTIIALITARSITDPIEKLTRLTNDISRGQMETKLEEGVMESKDEIGDLARAFDRIIVSLKLAMRTKEEKPNA